LAEISAQNLEGAEDYFRNALEILQKHNHPDQYLALKGLAGFYSKKAIYEKQRGDLQMSLDLKNKCTDS
jgi:hypothetical protein